MHFDTFEAFMAYANKVVSAKFILSCEDFADAAWYDLYEDSNGDIHEDDIFDTLADADDIFAQMLELHKQSAA